MSFGRTWFEPECLADLTDTLGEIAALTFDYAEKVQGGELLLAMGEHFAIQRRSSVELARAMGSKATIEKVVQVDACHDNKLSYLQKSRRRAVEAASIRKF